jgi:hypothetical protein
MRSIKSASAARSAISPGRTPREARRQARAQSAGVRPWRQGQAATFTRSPSGAAMAMRCAAARVHIPSTASASRPNGVAIWRRWRARRGTPIGGATIPRNGKSWPSSAGRSIEGSRLFIPRRGERNAASVSITGENGAASMERATCPDIHGPGDFRRRRSVQDFDLEGRATGRQARLPSRAISSSASLGPSLPDAYSGTASVPCAQASSTG